MKNILFFLSAIVILTISLSSKAEIIVKSSKVKTVKFYDEVELPCILNSKKNVEFFAQMNGRVNYISSKVGSFVKKNEIIIKIDENIAESMLSHARSSFFSAEASFLREKNLFEKKLSSKQNYEKIKADYFSAKANLESTISKYDSMIIKAPFDSYCDVPSFKEGSQVKNGDYLTKFSSNENGFLAKFFLPENSKIIFSDLIAKILFNNEEYQSENIRISKILDIKSGSYSSEAEIKNGIDLTDNSSARIKLQFNFRDSISVPEKSIIKTENGNAVYVIKDDIAKLINIEIFKIQDGYREVKSKNLKPGDRVISEGIMKIYDGIKVKDLVN